MCFNFFLIKFQVWSTRKTGFDLVWLCSDNGEREVDEEERENNPPVTGKTKNGVKFESFPNFPGFVSASRILLQDQMSSSKVRKCFKFKAPSVMFLLGSRTNGTMKASGAKTVPDKEVVKDWRADTVMECLATHGLDR